MNADEVNSAVQGLANAYGIPTFVLPLPTAEGRGTRRGQVGGGINKDAYHVYLTAGVHARERGGPDNIIYFIADLLYAQKNGIGLAYGSRTYTNADVLKVLNTGIVFIPLINPDGLSYDQATDSLWRKNRNRYSSASDPAKIGVDIDRNHNILWDFRNKFSPAVVDSPGLASDNPADYTYHGTRLDSDAETLNMQWVIGQFKKVRYFMDLHSAACLVRYPWGIDDVQNSNRGMDFRNWIYDDKRGILGDDEYREYMSKDDNSLVRNVASRVATGMSAAAGRLYQPSPAADVFPVSGTAADWMFSRFQANPATWGKIYAFTMEFGYPTNFYPTRAEFQQSVLDTGAGLMEFCLAAAAIGWA